MEKLVLHIGQTFLMIFHLLIQSMQKKWKQVSDLILKVMKLRQIGHFSSSSIPKDLLLLPTLLTNKKYIFYLLGAIGIGFDIL